MRASLVNNVRNVEPQKMLHNFVMKERSNFLRRKQAAAKCTSPVPPHVERILAKLITRSRSYQESVQFTDGSNMMEATVASQTDPTVRRRVVISSEEHVPPSCCSYSQARNGLPCYHGVAVICEKYGTMNLFKFISKRHLTTEWKKQYEGIDFDVPNEADIEEVFAGARRLVETGGNIHIPLAIAPPRGRPFKEAGRRKRSWFERGPSRKRRRTYNCSYCSQAGHSSITCPLRQGSSEHSRTSTPGSTPGPSSAKDVNRGGST